jgi:HSP20 family protein
MLPPVDVIEDALGITLYADLPGVPKDKLHVRIDADALTIEGEVSLPLAGNLEPSHVEVQMPRYQRTFTLGKELDSEKVSRRVPPRRAQAEHSEGRARQAAQDRSSGGLIPLGRFDEPAHRHSIRILEE